MKNLEMAKILQEIGDILEVEDENPFRIRAYRKAAQNLESLTEDMEELAAQDRLTEIPGVGQDLALKIKEFLATGKVKFHQKLVREVPKGLLDIMAVPGVGPKTAKLLSEKLAIKGIDDLEKKAKAGKIAGLPGMKTKTEENILKGIEFLRRGKGRTPLGTAYSIANQIMERLKRLPEVKRICPAGSLRRMKETVRDIDILVTSTDPLNVMRTFTSLPLVQEVVAQGPTKSTIIAKEGIQVDVRVVDPESFGAALAYFTGSKNHNIRIREMAVRKGLKINEYGVFRVKTEKRIGGAEEKEVYGSVGLPYISPELREDTGEIETGLKRKLPKLVELGDIKGDLHVHSNYSDGFSSIEELARQAKEMGYQYICITDHSKRLPVAGGLKEADLLKQIKEIRALNKKLAGFRVLTGIEIEILNDGSLDYKDGILAQLDLVIAAIHSGFKQGKDKLTRRIIEAMKNRWVNVIAHPTGRLMGVRDAYELDLEEVFKAAKATNTALEINALPQRSDLNDINSRRAGELGVPLIIATDAHAIDQLGNMFFGVNVARRGWLEKKNILNTLSLERLFKAISKR